MRIFFPSTLSAIGLMVANFAAECAILTIVLSFVIKRNTLKPLTWSMLLRNFLFFSLSLPFFGCHLSSEDILVLVLSRAPPRLSMSDNSEYANLTGVGVVVVVVVIGSCPHMGRRPAYWADLALFGDLGFLDALVSWCPSWANASSSSSL